MNEIIYISRRCDHCQELLILLHKYKEHINFKVIDVDTNAFPKKVTTVPCMLINNKILPGIELFKFIEYLLKEKGILINKYDKSINKSPQNNPPQNNPPQNNPPQNKPPHDSKKDDSKDPNIDSMDGFCFNNGSCLMYSSIDDNNDNDDSFLFSNYEKLDSDNSTKSCNIDGFQNKSDKEKIFNNDFERLSEERRNDMVNTVRMN